MRPLLVYKKYLNYALKFGDSRKFRNLFLNHYEYKTGKSRLRSFPLKVTLDPGNVCNLECPGCHTGVKHPDRMTAKMLRYDDFVQIFDQVSPYIFHLAMYNWGEPFLNKKIFDMVAYAKSKNVGVTIHSNLNHFNERMAEDCVKSGLTHLYLSIDGSTDLVYRKYRVGGELPAVLKNLQLLIEAKRKFNSAFPYITWKFLEFEHNRHQVEDARRHASLLGADSFESFTASPRLMDIQDESQYYLENADALMRLKPQCKSLWNSMYIGPDGSVFPCSLAFRESEVFGNLLKNEIGEVWNHENYLESRRFFSGNLDSKPHSPCDSCKYFHRCHLS